jgi:uncharacterized membrane protein
MANSPPQRPALRRALLGVLGVITVAYPVGVWWSLGHLPPWAPGLLIAAVALLRVAITGRPLWWILAAVALLLALAGWLAHDWLPAKLYPVAVNAALLAAFGYSLYRGPPMVERLARLSEPSLSAEAIAYTRRVTVIWVVFFGLNGSIALVTALWAPDAVWALYNGVIAYVLVALLFAVEYLVRRRVRARHASVIAART